MKEPSDERIDEVIGHLDEGGAPEEIEPDKKLEPTSALVVDGEFVDYSGAHRVISGDEPPADTFVKDRLAGVVKEELMRAENALWNPDAVINFESYEEYASRFDAGGSPKPVPDLLGDEFPEPPMRGQYQHPYPEFEAQPPKWPHKNPGNPYPWGSINYMRYELGLSPAEVGLAPIIQDGSSVLADPLDAHFKDTVEKLGLHKDTVRIEQTAQKGVVMIHAIPIHVGFLMKACPSCHRWFFTRDGYRGHWLLVHYHKLGQD